MEPSKEAIAVRITRLNRQILGKVTSGVNKFSKKTIDREALLDALVVLYDECNDDPVKKSDELVRAFVDKYRSTLAELRRTRVCLSDFKVLETIGRGHFAEVHMVREKQTGDVYALKTLRKEEARKRAVASTEDERDVLANANSPWIPRLQYAYQDNSNLYLVMELCSGGDLAGLLSRRNSPLSECDAAFYVAEVAQALKALHGMGYVHRDVKPHNILLDRCGHVKLGDLGSCGRLSEGSCGGSGAATPDYVAPELLAAAHCASRHTVCLEYCRGIVAQAISACDYWSLGVIAFELVTLRRPFSVGDEDKIVDILSNIQKYERDPNSEPPFDPVPDGPSGEWRALVSGLLRVQPARRYNYLDTLQHAALAHLPVHSIRDQVPPWVPCVRGPEDASYFSPVPRVAPPPSVALFRARPPFGGQLPFLGYSYVAPEQSEDSTTGFNASHDCTAIDLATYKSAEKLAAMRSREITSLQNKLAATEASVGVAVERTRRELENETERQRVRLQAEITALTLQNKRLERQLEVEKEERMALQRTNQELSAGIAERNSAEVRAVRAEAVQLQAERDALREDLHRLEGIVRDLQVDCTRALAAADAQRMQHQHYKDIIEKAQDLRHRTLTEINVRAIESVAKERAIRRQTLSGGENESREAAARLAQAEANTAREVRARELLDKRFTTLQEEHATLQTEFDQIQRELASTREALNEKQQNSETSSNRLKDVQQQLAQERLHSSILSGQVQELERNLKESTKREAVFEEQYVRTEAQLHERLQAAETRANNALQEDTRHREKVNSLEQLVRQLEREVTALETRGCPRCATRAENEATGTTHSAQSEAQRDAEGAQSAALRVSIGSTTRGDVHSDTESLADATHAQLTLLKEQLERAEAQLQARAEEMAALRQETRAANLARWRKEREYNELSVEAKSSARDLKRLEERLSSGIAARKAAELKATSLQNEITTLRPQYEQARNDVERLTEQLQKLQKSHETAQAEVDRSRNDIRKLKSELQYSEKRRMHAEEQEELSSRERAQLRDEMQETRQRTNEIVVNNKALQEACSLLEEQLTDLEKLTDIQEAKNNDLEGELQRIRGEMESWRSRALEAEKLAAEKAAAAELSSAEHGQACERANQAISQLQLLKERLESREVQVAELEVRAATLENEVSARDAEAGGVARRMRDLHEECASLRTAAHHHHAAALRLQAELADTQEELAAAREAAEAASAWWRTRETKTEATLRQQAKLIDFLQAKVEELGRKKCSLGNKLFGRTGRRAAANSPPLRRANRELREEVERLRSKLAALKNENDYPPTPQRPNAKKKCNGVKNIEMIDETRDNSLQIVWADGTRERVRVRSSDGALLLNETGTELRAKLHSLDTKNLPQNEANRAFTVKVEYCGKRSEAAIVCTSIAERAQWVSKLQPSEVANPGYTPVLLARHDSQPAAALHIAPSVVAIGCADGLHSLRGAVSIELDSDVSPPRRSDRQGVTCVDAACARTLIVYNGSLVQGGLLPMGSALRRAGNLNPTVTVSKVKLPEGTPPHLIKTISGDAFEGPCAAVACGRRVFLLRFDASASEFKISRSLTVDRPPTSLLLTSKYLFITGEKPLKINLPSGALESFAMDEPTVAAAVKKQSPPKAILLIREKPLEIFICYAECGVFVDENGKRTRNEDPKWSSAVHGWEFVNPFLYIVGEEKVTIIYLSEEAYKSPPCTCDTTSLTSTSSDCYAPQIFNLKLNEPALLGKTPNGIIIRSKIDDGYSVFVVEGLAAFRSIGASVESLDTISDAKRSSTDLGPSVSDVSVHEISQESVEATTGFLADIRQRARQLRSKNRKEQTEPTPDEIIKRILTTEVGLKRTSMGRKSPETVSEFDSDSTESEERTASTKCTADLCAEMFTKQVKFQ